MKVRNKTGVGLLVMLLSIALIAAACGSDSTIDTSSPDGTEADSGSGDGGNMGSQTEITLAISPWNGSAVNIAVAEQLLESELGYTVETVEIDENATWGAINSGDIDAALEVWPSGHQQNIVDFIENPDAKVANAGELGPVGKIGWYVPTYVVDANPDLKTWEGFSDPALAGLFATAETGDKGQFLGGDPSFVQYDEAIIDNLELPLEVVYAGSEEAILASLDAAYSREEPVLVYLWTPHSAHNKYDLTEIELPAYSDTCYEGADSGGVDCDYPADVLFKIAGTDLATNAPDADAFIRNMNYTTEDQVAMLASVETDGMSIEDAAAKWIAENEDTWKAWLP